MYAELAEYGKESKVLDHVKEQKWDYDGKLIGASNENPILNTAL